MKDEGLGGYLYLWNKPDYKPSVFRMTFSRYGEKGTAEVTEAVRHEGRVKWFSADKGFGFLDVGDGIDVYCHHSAILMDGYRTLTEGQKVTFELCAGPKGRYAENVKPI